MKFAIITIRSWGQRKEPDPNTIIVDNGADGFGDSWQSFRHETEDSPERRKAIYLGDNKALLPIIQSAEIEELEEAGVKVCPLCSKPLVKGETHGVGVCP